MILGPDGRIDYAATNAKQQADMLAFYRRMGLNPQTPNPIQLNGPARGAPDPTAWLSGQSAEIPIGRSLAQSWLTDSSRGNPLPSGYTPDILQKIIAGQPPGPTGVFQGGGNGSQPWLNNEPPTAVLPPSPPPPGVSKQPLNGPNVFGAPDLNPPTFTGGQPGAFTGGQPGAFTGGQPGAFQKSGDAGGIAQGRPLVGGNLNPPIPLKTPVPGTPTGVLPLAYRGFENFALLNQNQSGMRNTYLNTLNQRYGQIPGNYQDREFMSGAYDPRFREMESNIAPTAIAGSPGFMNAPSQQAHLASGIRYMDAPNQQAHLASGIRYMDAPSQQAHLLSGMRYMDAPNQQTSTLNDPRNMKAVNQKTALMGGPRYAQMGNQQVSFVNPPTGIDWTEFGPKMEDIKAQTVNARTGTASLSDMQNNYGQFGSADPRAALADTLRGDPTSNPYLAQMHRANINDSLRGYQDALDQFNQNVLPGIKSKSVLSGGYGGSRQGIAEGLAMQQQLKSARDIGINAQDVGAEMYGKAFADAKNRQANTADSLSQQAGLLGQFNAGQSQDMTRANMDAMNQMGQFNANLGLEAGKANNQFELARADQVAGLRKFNIGNQFQAALANQEAANLASRLNKDREQQRQFFNIGNEQQAKQFNTSSVNRSNELNADRGMRQQEFNIGNELSSNTFNAQARNETARLNAERAMQQQQFNLGREDEYRQYNADTLNRIAGLNVDRNIGQQQFNLGREDTRSQLNTDILNRVAGLNADRGMRQQEFNLGREDNRSQFNADILNRVAGLNADRNTEQQRFNIGNNLQRELFNTGNVNDMNRFRAQQDFDAQDRNNQYAAMFADAAGRNRLTGSQLAESRLAAQDNTFNQMLSLLGMDQDQYERALNQYANIVEPGAGWGGTSTTSIPLYGGGGWGTAIGGGATLAGLLGSLQGG